MFLYQELAAQLHSDKSSKYTRNRGFWELVFSISITIHIHVFACWKVIEMLTLRKRYFCQFSRRGNNVCHVTFTYKKIRQIKEPEKKHTDKIIQNSPHFELFFRLMCMLILHFFLSTFSIKAYCKTGDFRRKSSKLGVL